MGPAWLANRAILSKTFCPTLQLSHHRRRIRTGRNQSGIHNQIRTPGFYAGEMHQLQIAERTAHAIDKSIQQAPDYLTDRSPIQGPRTPFDTRHHSGRTRVGNPNSDASSPSPFTLEASDPPKPISRTLVFWNREIRSMINNEIS